MGRKGKIRKDGDRKRKMPVKQLLPLTLLLSPPSSNQGFS